MAHGDDQFLKIELQRFFLLVKELKCAEALFHLYWLHKNDIKTWNRLKKMIITSADSYRTLCLSATLLQASTKSSLSESCRLVPGLFQFLGQ